MRIFRSLPSLFILFAALQSSAVTPPIYGPVKPVFIGAETFQFGYYGSVQVGGGFQATFEGIDASQWQGTTEHSANPNGAVGPSVYAQWTQGGFQAFDKATGIPLLCPVNSLTNQCPNGITAPVPWGTFWDGSAGSAVYECGHGSPTAGVLIYDQLDAVPTSLGAQRDGHWIIATHVNHGAHLYYCVAVSNGSNILNATWNEYEYQLDGNGSGGQGGVLPYSTCSAGCITGLYTPDYQKLGTSVEVKQTNSYLGGLFATWDLYAPGSADSYVAGFETCVLNRNDLVNGRSSTAMSCYYYLPANNFPWITNKSNQSVVHSLLPADFEGTVSPSSSTVSEYFLATVNPYTGTLANDEPCVSSPCTSTQIALFTLGMDNTHPLTGPKLLTVKSFTPGCYNTANVRNTYCVAQPTSGKVIDSIGDRLMHRLAYRIISSTTTEQLVSAQSIAKGSSPCTAKDSDPCTIIEWYKIVNPGATKPTLLQGAVTDPGHTANFLFMPSVAMNYLGNLRFTFEESGDKAHPSIYSVGVSFANPGGVGPTTEGSVGLIAAGQGDELDSEDFGEYFSTTIDPCDDTTFWGTGEYFATSETSKTGINWLSRIYTTATTTPKECPIL